MSAFVLHPPTPSREWLPMPIDDTDDSFARDLIRQFDKKQSRLRHEMAELENRNTTCSQPQDSLEKGQDPNIEQPSSICTKNTNNDEDEDEDEGEDEQQEQQELQHQQPPPPLSTTMHADVQQRPRLNIVLTDQQQQSRVPSPPDSLDIEDHPEPPQPEPPPTPPSPATTINKMKQRTAAAGDLLRRSSAYLRTKFLKNVARPEDTNNRQQQEENFDNAIPTPAKIAINTTISIPHHPPAHHTGIQPPIITHYPPRPLKYAPVEPLESEPRKNVLHRISLPVLSRATFHPEKRRSSDTTKAKLWSLFRLSKKSKGKEQTSPGPS